MIRQCFFLLFFLSLSCLFVQAFSSSSLKQYFPKKTVKRHKSMNLADIKELLNKLYDDRDGYSIEKEEINSIIKAGGEPTYGEIIPEGVQKLFQLIPLKKNDIFYDLGSGVGKLNLQAYLTTPVKKSIGIELSKKRFSLAQSAKKELKQLGLLDNKRELNFYNKSILDVPLEEATVVYMASTCFPEKLMRDITDKLSQNKQLTLMTLVKLPKPNNFKLVKTYTIPMSWSKNTKVYVYQLNEK